MCSVLEIIKEYTIAENVAHDLRRKLLCQVGNILTELQHNTNSLFRETGNVLETATEEYEGALQQRAAQNRNATLVNVLENVQPSTAAVRSGQPSTAAVRSGQPSTT
eukprot:Lankesteria_metandrocarpae@DN9779_c0_g1_i1.p1